MRDIRNCKLISLIAVGIDFLKSKTEIIRKYMAAI